MSADDGSGIELRRCTFCRESSLVSDDDGIYLFKYSVRHYAHAICLAKKFGTKVALALLPKAERPEFRSWIRLAGDWDRAAISVVDKRAASRARRIRASAPEPEGT